MLTMERPLTGFFSFLPDDDAAFLPPLPLAAFFGEPSFAGLGERPRFPSSDMLAKPFDHERLRSRNKSNAI